MNENTNKEDKFSYNAAVAELEKILTALQSENTDIDAMVVMTRRATELIRQCRERLIATDAELRNVLETLRDQQ